MKPDNEILTTNADVALAAAMESKSFQRLKEPRRGRYLKSVERILAAIAVDCGKRWSNVWVSELTDGDGVEFPTARPLVDSLLTRLYKENKAEKGRSLRKRYDNGYPMVYETLQAAVQIQQTGGKSPDTIRQLRGQALETSPDQIFPGAQRSSLVTVFGARKLA